MYFCLKRCSILVRLGPSEVPITQIVSSAFIWMTRFAFCLLSLLGIGLKYKFAFPQKSKATYVVHDPMSSLPVFRNTTTTSSALFCCAVRQLIYRSRHSPIRGPAVACMPFGCAYMMRMCLCLCKISLPSVIDSPSGE